MDQQGLSMFGAAFLLVFLSLQHTYYIITNSYCPSAVVAFIEGFYYIVTVWCDTIDLTQYTTG